MFRPRWLIVHTAADPRSGGTYDTSANEIRAWHIARGWDDIGYHYVVRRSGVIEPGRPETMIGAHAQGANQVSLGVCLSGHGDLALPTAAQMDALIRLLAQLCRKYGIPPHRVIGHREVHKVKQGLSTTKTCPGKLIDMDLIRKRVEEALN